MGKKKKNKKVKAAEVLTFNYEPMGEEISIDAALVQATALLDFASQSAVQSGSATEMANASFGWSTLAQTMTQIRAAALEMEFMDNENSKSRRRQVGFGKEESNE